MPGPVLKPGLREPFPGYPPPLTTRPEGLLSSLGIQTNGKYPQHLATDALLPVYDLGLWYQESRAEIQMVSPPTFGGQVAGNFLSVQQVPPQEVWILLGVGMRITASTAVACTYRIARARNNDFRSLIPLSDLMTTSATNFPSVAMDPAWRGIVVRPSVHIGIYLESGAPGAGATCDFTVRFVRCTI